MYQSGAEQFFIPEIPIVGPQRNGSIALTGFYHQDVAIGGNVHLAESPYSSELRLSRLPSVSATHDNQTRDRRQRLPERSEAMPHAVITGAPSLEQIWRGFEPQQEVLGSDVRNLQGAYLRSDGTQLLVLALVIELGVTQRFMIVVEQKKTSTVVRCQLHTPVEKTAGVKALVERVARMLIDGGGSLEKTNLPDL